MYRYNIDLIWLESLGCGLLNCVIGILVLYRYYRWHGHWVSNVQINSVFATTSNALFDCKNVHGF